jgi:hypothetical protein
MKKRAWIVLLASLIISFTFGYFFALDFIKGNENIYLMSLVVGMLSFFPACILPVCFKGGFAKKNFLLSKMFSLGMFLGFTVSFIAAIPDIISVVYITFWSIVGALLGLLGGKNLYTKPNPPRPLSVEKINLDRSW